MVVTVSANRFLLTHPADAEWHKHAFVFFNSFFKFFCSVFISTRGASHPADWLQAFGAPQVAFIKDSFTGNGLPLWTEIQGNMDRKVGTDSQDTVGVGDLNSWKDESIAITLIQSISQSRRSGRTEIIMEMISMNTPASRVNLLLMLRADTPENTFFNTVFLCCSAYWCYFVSCFLSKIKMFLLGLCHHCFSPPLNQTTFLSSPPFFCPGGLEVLHSYPCNGPNRLNLALQPDINPHVSCPKLYICQPSQLAQLALNMLFLEGNLDDSKKLSYQTPAEPNLPTMLHKKDCFIYFFSFNLGFRSSNQLCLSNVPIFHQLISHPSVEKSPAIIYICQHTSKMPFKGLEYANVFNQLSALQRLALMNMQHHIVFSPFFSLDSHLSARL